MRSRARLLIVATVTATVGCTLLVQFEDMDASSVDASPPNRADRTTNEPDVDEQPDATLDPPDANQPDGAPIPFPPPCDEQFPRDQVKCNPQYPRPNCAKNMAVFPTYPAARNEDLVTCNGGTAPPSCVQHCPFGCYLMPAGIPDLCNDCYGRKDGTYCLKDLRGADPRTHAYAVVCKDGMIASQHNCGTAAACATKCTRNDPVHAPSCCI